MELLKDCTKLRPFIAPINHNTLPEAKAIQIVHSFLMGNFFYGDPTKISQMEDMGNYACLIVGYLNKVSQVSLFTNLPVPLH